MEKPSFSYVTGIGMTDLGEANFGRCERLGFYLCEQGYSWRSGKAPGADQAFQVGFERSMNNADHIRDHQIFLPWRKFELDNGFTSNNYDYWQFEKESIEKSKAVCATVHPVWDDLSPGQQLFHIRNVFQALGPDCETPSKFVIACSPEDSEGLPKGGTRTAFKIARDRDIPCINIYNLSDDLVYDWLNKVIGELIE